MGKLKRIGGLLFRHSKIGLHYAGVAGRKTYGTAKYLHGAYKSHKAGELGRLRQKNEKERLKAQIRGYKQRYKPKGRDWIGSLLKQPKISTVHRRHVKHKGFPKKHHRRRVTEYY